jgi:hypothetical protein
VSLAAQLRPALRRGARWLSRALVEPPLPLLAVEVRPRSLAAVRLAAEKGRLALAAAASVELPPGVLSVSLTKPNVLDAGALQAALRAVLERVGALAGGAVSLVLPDPTVRLAVIPAAGLRGHGRDAQEIVRFRMHKALPFDVREARLAWETAGEQALVAVAPDAVVSGYEEALEGLGFRPGLVEPASLALCDALAAEASSGDRLLVNWDEEYVSFVLLREGRPLLIRTLPGESGAEAVARQAAGTLQFYAERLAGPGLAGVIVRSAAVPGEEALALLGRGFAVAPRLFAPWAALGIDENGAAAQAVAGAAACVLRRAA